MLTTTTVRTRDAVYPLFGNAGTKQATEAEGGPDEAQGPSHLARQCKMTQVENKASEELRRRDGEASADAAGARPTMGGTGSASAAARRRSTGKGPAGPVERREERQSGGDDPDREEPPTRRQRVARAVVQLRALVAMAGESDSDQCCGM